MPKIKKKLRERESLRIFPYIGLELQFQGFYFYFFNATLWSSITIVSIDTLVSYELHASCIVFYFCTLVDPKICHLQ